MIKKILILVIIFYILVLFQSSFLVHFPMAGVVPNLVFILIVLLIFFEGTKKNTAIVSAFIGGFFLDVFSGKFIGFYILIFLGLSILIKFLLRKYLRLRINSKSLIP